MSTVSEPELLRMAARKIRDTAAAATPGPWEYAYYDYPTGGHSEVVHPVEIFPGSPGHPLNVFKTDDDTSWPLLPRDGAWIALLSPAISEPLAAWLEFCAHWMDEVLVGPNDKHAVAVARVICEGP